MEFVKEFATFLYQNGIIKFGDFTLASGKKSPYYIDLRAVPSYPHQYRRMIKHLQNAISEKTGLDSFDAIASVPTGGLAIASALALETVKPLIYMRRGKTVRNWKLIEGVVRNGMRVLFIDDVATTGGSVIKGIRALKESGVKTSDCYVIANRMEGASEALRNEGVALHHLFSIPEIATILYHSNLIDDATLKRVQA